MNETRKLKLEELNRMEIEDYLESEKIPLDIVLDNIRSGLNVGSVFRTSDAFRINKVYLCGITVRPPHKEILKTAIGANNSVNWQHNESIVSLLMSLKKDGKKIIGIEQTTSSVFLNDFNIQSNDDFALVFGNEVNGISEDALPYIDEFIEIPQYGTKHSLNISVCAGIVIHHFASKLLTGII